MKNRLLLSVAPYLLVTLLCGCAAKPVITPVALQSKSPFNEKTNELTGIPFRVPTDQVVRIFRWDFVNRKYKEVSSSRQTMADYSRLYVIDVRGSSFASPSLHISENPDNTLKSMNVTSTASAAAASALGTAVAGIAKAQTDKSNAALTANTAVATAQKNLRDAMNSLATLPAATSPEVRASYQATVTTAQQQLNAACAAAAVTGMPCQ